MTVALILAAGSGQRLGAEQPKAFVELAGRPLLQWSIDVLAAVEQIERVVVALPPGIPAPAGVIAVEGGPVRSDSVRRALAVSDDVASGESVAGEDEIVLVHDAARPLLSAALVERVIAALAEDPDADAAIAAVPVKDTVKRVDRAGAVTETLDRASLWAVQTPQVFRRGALERALEVSAAELAEATDDAWLIERRGGRVLVVASSEQNLKVTTPVDLALAELLLERRARRAG